MFMKFSLLNFQYTEDEIKLKMTLWKPWRYMDEWMYILIYFCFGARCTWMVKIKYRPIYPQWKSLQYALI